MGFCRRVLTAFWWTTTAVLSAEDSPSNRWKLIHEEDASGGKRFAKAIYAESVGQVYLWGTGGRKPARNVYERFELERFDPANADRGWSAALPAAARSKWGAQDFPPFRIYGQGGPDGLKYDAGPRLQTVGGYHSVNRVRWWDFDGISRPSPVLTFNMGCWDSQRKRILYYSDGRMLSLDPATNHWTDLEAQNYPATCKHVAWASLCYDAGRDRALLFGGGLATNPSGGAPTWIYDCKTNQWARPELGLQPPLRCNGALVYDAASGSVLLSGGYDQAAALNDTWVFDCKSDRWSRRKPRRSPPPMFQPAAASIGSGKVLVVGNDARKVKRTHLSTSSAVKETWLFDLANDQWTPLGDDLSLPGYSWLTACGSNKDAAALLVAFGPQRRTYALHLDPDAAAADLPGAPDGTLAWKYPQQKASLEAAPPPNREQHAKWLAELPPNTFVNVEPPGVLSSKTWSTATIDTDRSEVIYHGGGHSGYSGNDFARYNIAENRWSLDSPPRFPPFLEGTNAGIYGWSYGMVPFSQHTYLWYTYNPSSKQVVYLARPSIQDGVDVQLDDGAASTFTYSIREHGYASWLYDSATKKMHRPIFGRPFKNPWHLSLVGIPLGTFAACNNELYLASVERGNIAWKLIDKDFPKPREAIKYHYEYQPLVHDSKRDRLIQLKGDKDRVDVFARPATVEGRWEQLAVTGKVAIGREAMYIARHDVVLWLGDKLHVLDCATNRMAELDIRLPKGLYGHECAMVYDPKHDVCVALIPTSFTGPMQTFLFRFEATTPAGR